MRDIVLEALSKGPSGAYQLALEHHTSMQAGDGALLDDEEQTKILRYFDSSSLKRPLNASWYGIAMMRLAVAAYDVEAQKLIGGCRLLRALIAIEEIGGIKEASTQTEESERKRIKRSKTGPIAPAKLRMNKSGSPTIDLKPLQEEVATLYQNTLAPYAAAIGTIRGFHRWQRTYRVNTSALKKQIKRYQNLLSSIAETIAQFDELIGGEVLKAPSLSHIVSDNEADMIHQCTLRLRGTYE